MNKLIKTSHAGANLKKTTIARAKQKKAYLQVKNPRADLAIKGFLGIRGKDEGDHCKGRDGGSTHCKFTNPEIIHIKGSHSKNNPGQEHSKAHSKDNSRWILGDKILGTSLDPSDYASVSFTGNLTKELTKSLATLDCYIGKERILVPLANLDAVKKIMK